jgi:hypothetical protein
MPIIILTLFILILLLQHPLTQMHLSLEKAQEAMKIDRNGFLASL